MTGPEHTVGAYGALAETVEHDDPRWGFGGGAEAAGTAVTAPVPPGVDAADLTAYCLMFGDDALVLSHRLTQWVADAPELEEEVALANIALDLLGQARVLLARAGHVEGAGRDEDTLAFLREPAQFRNVTLAELPDELDFARAVARLLVLSCWRLALLSRLVDSADPALAALAARAVPELTHHRDYAARWTVRLGDGTAESHRRMQAALDATWPHLDELFATSDTERRLVAAGVAVDPARVRDEVGEVLEQVLAHATLSVPTVRSASPVGGRAGRDGLHSEALGHVLDELQGLARRHRGATW